MGKIYDKNGDVIRTADQLKLCRLAEYLYLAVDDLLYLGDEQNLNLFQAVRIYQNTAEQIEQIIEVSPEELLNRYSIKFD